MNIERGCKIAEDACKNLVQIIFLAIHIRISYNLT